MEKVYPVYSEADRLAPLCLAQLEDSSVIAELLEFKLSSYTPHSNQRNLGTQTQF